MQRWSENHVENSQRKCITVNINGDFEGGKVLYMEPDWTFHEFLNAASVRVGLVSSGNRLFSVDGVEIDDCMMIEDDDMLFVSIDDDFIPPVQNGIHNLRGQSNSIDLTRRPTGEVNEVIGGYKVSQFLGKGGFGEVRVGEHQLTGERVALKFLRKADILSIGAAERTVTEIQCLTTLKHQNIIRLQHNFETVQHVVLIFELMEGGDLMRYLSKRGTTSPEIALPEDEARPLFHQILGGISFAHNQHICHRDLKLENILLKGPNLSHVKIADFGLSDFYRPGSTMKSNCGTISFLAPEVFRGTSNAGPPLDVWSLGVILFAVLCGRLPFEGVELSSRKRPREAIIKSRILKCQYKIDEHLGPEVKDLVRRMLKLDPEERASIPEVFNHCWMRASSNNQYSFNSDAHSYLTTPSIGNLSLGGSSTFHKAESIGKLNIKQMKSLPRARVDSIDSTDSRGSRVGLLDDPASIHGGGGMPSPRLGVTSTLQSSAMDILGMSSVLSSESFESVSINSKCVGALPSDVRLNDSSSSQSLLLSRISEVGESGSGLNLEFLESYQGYSSGSAPNSFSSTSSSPGGPVQSPSTLKLIPLRRSMMISGGNVIGDGNDSDNDDSGSDRAEPLALGFVKAHSNNSDLVIDDDRDGFGSVAKKYGLGKLDSPYRPNTGSSVNSHRMSATVRAGKSSVHRILDNDNDNDNDNESINESGTLNLKKSPKMDTTTLRRSTIAFHRGASKGGGNNDPSDALSQGDSRGLSQAQKITRRQSTIEGTSGALGSPSAVSSGTYASTTRRHSQIVGDHTSTGIGSAGRSPSWRTTGSH